MNAFTSVLIVACPCALALTIPFAFGSAMRLMGKSGFYLKKNEVIERLTKITTIVFDKTGTITQNDDFEVDAKNAEMSEHESLRIKSLVKHSPHPMSVAIYQSLSGKKLFDIDGYKEIPAEGIEGMVDGNLIRLGSETFIIGQRSDKEAYASRVYISIDGIPKGYYQIKNKYRPALEKVINKLGKKYDLHLLSGDNDSEKETLILLFGNEENIHFNQSPSDKLHYIQQLKQKGKNILMIGDGLNDAGALLESDVGISIADNIYHFSPACDAILESKKFSKLQAYLSFTGVSLGIVKVSFVISFLYNLIGIAFAVQGFLTPVVSAILMPISSVSIVAFVTFSTALMARRRKL
jgi:Cu+-exporting ATPase